MAGSAAAAPCCNSSLVDQNWITNGISGLPSSQDWSAMYCMVGKTFVSGEKQLSGPGTKPGSCLLPATTAILKCLHQLKWNWNFFKTIWWQLLVDRLNICATAVLNPRQNLLKCSGSYFMLILRFENASSIMAYYKYAAFVWNHTSFSSCRRTGTKWLRVPFARLY